MQAAFLPPIAQPTAPRQSTPAGACDTHFHVFPSEARYPYAPDRGFTPVPASLAQWQRMAAAIGIERGVLVQPSAYGNDHRALFDALRAAPQQLRAVAAPAAGTSPETLHAWNGAGVRGVRLNHFMRPGGSVPVYPGGLSLDALEPMLPQVAALGWHVELWIDVQADWPALAERLQRWPRVDLVFDHMGCLRDPSAVRSEGFALMCRWIADGRAWAKLSGIDRVCPRPADRARARPIFEALLQAGADRLVWGTNWPHPHVERDIADDGELLDLFNDWTADAGLRQRILVDNPARLYGFALPERTETP